MEVESLLEDADYNQSPAFADVDLVGIPDAPLMDAAKRAELDIGALSILPATGDPADTSISRGKPTKIRRNCARSTPKGIASIGWSFIRPITL